MTMQDLVIATLWLAGFAGGIIGAAGLIYYGSASVRPARDRRRARRHHDRATPAAAARRRA